MSAQEHTNIEATVGVSDADRSDVAAPTDVSAPDQVAGPAPGQRDGWRRLDRRMLLVHPVTELLRFLPGLLAIFVVGRSSSPHQDWAWTWHYGPIVLVVLIGLLRYLTTTYRIGTEQVQVRKGLLSKHLLSARLDRVRTIDLTASPIHRLLGLSKVVIGTGSGSTDRDERLQLDSLRTGPARALREELLHRRHLETPPVAAPEGAAPDPAAASRGYGTPSPDRILVRLNPAWVRYAPLTTSGVLVALGALGFVANGINQLADNLWKDIADRVSSVHTPWLVVVGCGLLLTAVLVSILAIIGYLITNWGLTVSHNAIGHSYQLRRGMFTSRETSIDEDRIRGIEVGEPLGLRLAGGGRLAVIVTGLSGKEKSSSTLVPPAPAAVVRTVGEDILDEPGPLTIGLTPHGARARRRRYTRAIIPALLLIVAVTLAVLASHGPWWLLAPAAIPLVLAAPLAKDRYAGLGHALTPTYLVVRSGSFSGRRDALERDGIIGWNLDASFFQRRRALVNLSATTAAGRQSYTAFDLDEGVAEALADATTPGLLTPFLERG